MIKQDKHLNKARQTVYRLIKSRWHSEKEIYDKLLLRGFDNKEIKETLGYFKEINLINDYNFAESLIDYRLHKAFGLKRISEELEQKGVRKEIIEELINKKKSSCNETDTVINLIRKRLERLKTSQRSKEKIKSQIYAYLIRRGFQEAAVSNAVNQSFETTV